MNSIRQLLRSRAFTIPAISGLALAIGASTAVFSVFSAMLLRSMGFDDPARIVSLWQTDEAHGQKHVEVSYGDLLEWRKASAVFDEVALVSSVNLDWRHGAGGKPEHIDGTMVSGNFFRALGATPFAGRFFTDGEDAGRPGAPLPVVLSHRLWNSRFGADRSAIGRQYRMGDGSILVVGVARPEFDFPRDVATWAPLRGVWPAVEKSPNVRVFRAIARLKQGVSPAAAQAQMNVIARNVNRTLPAGSAQFAPIVAPILDEIYGAARPAVWILLGAVGLVVLIACANVANLLLARATERAREISIRAALGARRGRLVRLLLSESLVLATAAGALGLLLAAFGIRALVRFAPAEVPRVDQAAMDPGVLAFGIALSFATVALFGLAPAVMASNRDPNDALKQAGPRASGSRSQTRLRRVLIMGEVALSALLLVGAGLLVRSFARLSGIDPGFRSDRILTFRVTLDTPDQESRRAFYSAVLDRLRALPGVESAGAILLRPLSGAVGWDTTYAAEGQSPEQQATNPNGNYEAISPDYFRTMGIRLLAGRDFTVADTTAAPGAVILNESTARRHWRAGDAAGKRIRLGGPKSPWLTVVGVVSDVRYREWEAARPDFYIPYFQRAQHRSDFVVKTHGDPARLVAAVRREVFAIDKEQPISNVTTMDALVDRALARSRFIGIALAALAACALLLAAIGVYGVLSYAVARRTSEIGVRIAMGATPREVARLITAEGVGLVLAGATVGLLAAALIRGALTKLLFGVSGLDPASYAAAALLLLAIALAACVGPALRAASVDPMSALRSE